MRESNVVGFTPNRSAAPSAPLIFQPAVSQDHQQVFPFAAAAIPLR